ncbi:Pr6Pr family membrane protein [Chryseobacterium wanjuense]
MKRISALIFSSIGWFALIAQFYLMMENSVMSTTETTIRFFSYFTILTNLIVAIYLTHEIFKDNSNRSSGNLTAITIYILIVGIIYQIILRQLWQPTGLQKVVDELLHSVTPVLTLFYWYLYEDKKSLQYKMIPKWTVFPLLYLIFILIRGSFSNFYPYFFIDVNALGFTQTLMNAFWILVFFVGLSMLFIRIGKM